MPSSVLEHDRVAIATDLVRSSGELRCLIARFPDAALRDLYEGTLRVFKEIDSRGFDHWVVTFSGGKDSTLTALLALSYLSEMGRPPQLDVIYSDTRLEVPEMRDTASLMLKKIRSFSKEHSLPVRVRIVYPEIGDRFWARMIGRGYPPPKPRFRWCTHRLKIKPSAKYVDNGKTTAVLTGVRLGESTRRTGRLMATCATGGECGQDYWASRGPRTPNVTYFAPILQWRTCKVWDFLHLVAPLAGWPTEAVYTLYGDSSLRFGCWTCSLVERDISVETLISRGGQENLARLHEFRNYIVKESSKPEHRLMRHGHLGPLSMSFRRELLEKLLELQFAVGMKLISNGEIREIRRTWTRQEAEVAALPPAILPSASR